MGRHKKLETDIRQAMLLKAVGDHPWADHRWIQAYSGLSEWEMLVTQSMAKEQGLIEDVLIPSARRAPCRLGLTPAGAAKIGRRVTRGFLSEVLLCALKLDPARSLLTEWVGKCVVIWSLSPYTLPAKHVITPRPPTENSEQEYKGDQIYRSLRLDGLACLKFGRDEYLNVALLADPGDIKLDWFYHQFRSIYAWGRRREFEGRPRAFPVWVVVAANEARLGQLIQLWEATAAWGALPHTLRLTTYRALKLPANERVWWNELGRRTSLWGGAVPSELPSVKPSSAENGWWGRYVPTEAAVSVVPKPFVPKSKVTGLIRWAKRSRQPQAQLVRDHLRVTAQQRKLLKRIGRYPLITVSELAIVVGMRLTHVSAGLHISKEQGLKAWGLVEHPAPGESGYVLTWAGVKLLAAQAGFAPEEYAELVRWSVQYKDKKPRYSAQAWLTNREHTQLVLDFLVGLRRQGPAAGLNLRLWDHVQCVFAFPPQTASSEATDLLAFIIPDASGVVRAGRHLGAPYSDTYFWLEIDRGSINGRALMKKLARYYEVGGPREGLNGRPVRVLIVVERDDEARLQALRRRLITLNTHYRTQLDVRLTRVDLLEKKRGRLDPTRKVWRTLTSSEFVSAFNLVEG